MIRFTLKDSTAVEVTRCVASILNIDLNQITWLPEKNMWQIGSSDNVFVRHIPVEHDFRYQVTVRYKTGMHRKHMDAFALMLEWRGGAEDVVVDYDCIATPSKPTYDPANSY